MTGSSDFQRDKGFSNAEKRLELGTPVFAKDLNMILNKCQTDSDDKERRQRQAVITDGTHLTASESL